MSSHPKLHKLIKGLEEGLQDVIGRSAAVDRFFDI